MNLANKLTLLRIVLAPVFFTVYFLPVWIPSLFSNGILWIIPVLWFIFIGSQITDSLDGIAARKLNETSGFGKLFDPFADTLMQLTCLLCFVIDGILPAFLFLIVLYREFGILFLRNIMLKNGVVMGARMSGKVKTVSYIIAESAALVVFSLRHLQQYKIFEIIYPYFSVGTVIVFIISVVISVASFFDYLSVYRNSMKTDD